MYHHNCCCIHFLCQEVGMDGRRLHGTIAIGIKVLPMCCIYTCIWSWKDQSERSLMEFLEMVHAWIQSSLCLVCKWLHHACPTIVQVLGKIAIGQMAKVLLPWAFKCNMLKSLAWACIYIYICGSNHIWVGHLKLIGGGVFGVFYLHASLLHCKAHARWWRWWWRCWTASSWWWWWWCRQAL